MKINYNKLSYNMFGDVIVQEDPEISTSVEWLEVVVGNEDKKTPMWAQIIDKLVNKEVVG